MNRARQDRLSVFRDDPHYTEKLVLLKKLPPLGAESENHVGIYDHELEGKRRLLGSLEKSIATTAETLLPFERTKKGFPLMSATAIYQTAEQLESGGESHTRSWLQRSGKNPDGAIELHTDTISRGPEGGYVAITPSEGSEHLRLQAGQVALSREAYQNLSVDEQIALLYAVIETVYHIYDAQDYEDMLSAVPQTPTSQ